MQSCQAVIRNESDILNVGMSKPPKVASRPDVSKMKKRYYFKLKDNVDHQVLRRANVFGYIQTVDGRFSDSSGVLMKYFIQPVDPRVLY